LFSSLIHTRFFERIKIATASMPTRAFVSLRISGRKLGESDGVGWPQKHTCLF
jgi:hypothetical protein